LTSSATKRVSRQPLPDNTRTGKLSNQRRFVMPAQAGIHLRFRCDEKTLDSGLCRNDGEKTRRNFSLRSK
jgi:hypothetical protein